MFIISGAEHFISSLVTHCSMNTIVDYKITRRQKNIKTSNCALDVYTWWLFQCYLLKNKPTIYTIASQSAFCSKIWNGREQQIVFFVWSTELLIDFSSCQYVLELFIALLTGIFAYVYVSVVLKNKQLFLLNVVFNIKITFHTNVEFFFFFPEVLSFVVEGNVMCSSDCICFSLCL